MKLTQALTFHIYSSEPPRFHSTDQHYEHYFSYFYNRGQEKLTKSSPSAAYKPQMSLFQDTPSKRSSNAKRRGTANDNNQNLEYDSYLLKENNELPFGYSDSDWIDYPVDRPEKSVLKTPVEILNGKDVYDPKANNDEQFDPSMPIHRRCIQLGDINEVNKTGESVSVKNNLTKKTQKATEPLPLPRLPLTPKRIRGGQATAKKLLPTVHRVLLYNNQSPRSARKHHSSNSRSQNVKPPHPKGQGAGDQVTSYILEDPDAKLNDFRDPDYDNDDDLDNSKYYYINTYKNFNDLIAITVSNFDESDTVSISSDTEDGYRAHAYKLTHSGDRLLSSSKNSSTLLLTQSSDEDLRNPDSVLVSSLFPYVPPYLSFSSNTKKGPYVPPELHRVLKWRVTNIMPKVVRLILANSGMRMLKSKYLMP